MPVFLLGNPADRGAWWAIVHGVTKSWTQLSNGAHSMQTDSKVQVLSRKAPALLSPNFISILR